MAPGFLATTGIELLLGRDVSAHDRSDTARVVIVNETFGRRYCPDSHPIRCRFGDRGPRSIDTYEVIGFVRDAKYGTLRENPAPMICEALQQEDRASSVTLHVRARGNAALIASRLRDELRKVDDALTIHQARTIAQQINDSLRQERLMATFSAFFASLALLLTCIGLFGIVAYWALAVAACFD